MFFEKGDNTMAKTKEELDALKERIKTLKSEVKELSEEELKAIAGGDDETDCGKPSCPKCGSSNVTADYDFYVYRCNNCGYIFR